MSDRRLGPWLSLVRQGVELELEFGTHSLEALVWIAETVEQSVYEPGSLLRTPRGIVFALANPPLRCGAFRGVRVAVDRVPVEPDRLRVRTEGTPWRPASSISRGAPLALAPGIRTEFEVTADLPSTDRPLEVRLELDNVAIPPLVWFEFQAVARELSPS